MTTRYILFCTILVTIASLLYAATDAPEKNTTLEGQLVSASCYLNNSATGNDHGGTKKCGTGCLERGRPAGLLTKENDFHMLDAPSLRLAPYVGQELRVSGIDHKGILSVRKAEVKSGGGWETIDLKYHPTQSSN